MKSKDLRKKQFSDYSSQDDLPKGRSVQTEKGKRSKKPSIYDELDDELDDFYSSKYDEGDSDDGYNDDEDDYFNDEDEDDRY